MLHLRCGSDILDRLATAGLPGQAAEWSDPLCDGPLEPWIEEPARRDARAPWLASRYGRDLADVRSGLEVADGWLSRAPDEDEVVLWFEHDLFDQSILVYLLSRLEILAPERTSLICIGSHPEVSHFQGLGQLSAEQLAALFPDGVSVGDGGAYEGIVGNYTLPVEEITVQHEPTVAADPRELIVQVRWTNRGRQYLRTLSTMRSSEAI